MEDYLQEFYNLTAHMSKAQRFTLWANLEFNLEIRSINGFLDYLITAVWSSPEVPEGTPPNLFKFCFHQKEWTEDEIDFMAQLFRCQKDLPALFGADWEWIAPPQKERKDARRAA